MYWSFVAYDEGEVQGSPFNASKAKQLFNLDHFELLWEHRTDIKAVIGWSRDTVVVSFRGSASMSNALTDLNIWRKRHPFAKRTRRFGGLPMVHGGFLRAYCARDFNTRILKVIEKILHDCRECRRRTADDAAENGDAASSSETSGGEDFANTTCPLKCQVYVTGHSLGGALAVLCAYDIIKRNLCSDIEVSLECMTFGAPRVGNRAWARDFNATVRNCWQVRPP